MAGPASVGGGLPGRTFICGFVLDGIFICEIVICEIVLAELSLI
jgi:hypothetical protein